MLRKKGNQHKKFYIWAGAGLVLILALTLPILMGFLHRQDMLLINGKGFKQKDFIYDIYTVESEYNSVAKVYNSSLGISLDSEKMSDFLKEETENAFVERELLYKEALKENLKLSDKEKEELDKKAEDFLSKLQTKDAIKKLLTKKYLLKVLTKQALADNYKASIVKAASIDYDKLKSKISYEDYHAYKIQTLQYPLIILKGGTDYTDMTKEQKEEAFQIMQEKSRKAKDNGDFTKLAGDKVAYREVTFVKDEKTFDTDFENVLCSMKDGEISEVLSYKKLYYIVKMVDNKDSEKYEEAVKAEYTKAEDKAFQAKYKEIKKEYKIKEKALWKNLKLGEITSADSVNP